MAHQLIIKLIRPDTAVLDVGCGVGALACYMSQSMGCTVSAVDLKAEYAAGSRRFAKQCFVGNIEEQSTWDQIEGKFDHIVFADVLEHLASPSDALERCKGRLTESGSVIASVPNIAYYRIRQHLLFGRFDYAPTGILDMTHLRYFTAKTIAALLADCGYEVTDFGRVFTNPKNRLLGRVFPNAFAYEFVIRAVPSR